MLQVKNNFTEAAHIADELMSVDELTRKYMAVQRTVQRGVFGLDEALETYEVSKDAYLKYISSKSQVTKSSNPPRTNVSRPATEADLANFKDATIDMVELAEVPVVSKEAFITGEVSLEKEVEENNETVQGTVRKTEVDTENFTDETNKSYREKESGFYK